MPLCQWQCSSTLACWRALKKLTFCCQTHGGERLFRFLSVFVVLFCQKPHSSQRHSSCWQQTLSQMLGTGQNQDALPPRQGALARLAHGGYGAAASRQPRALLPTPTPISSATTGSRTGSCSTILEGGKRWPPWRHNAPSIHANEDGDVPPLRVDGVADRAPLHGGR